MEKTAVPDGLNPGESTDVLALGPFVVDTPVGPYLAFNLEKCDEESVIWGTEDRVHEVPAAGTPTVTAAGEIVIPIRTGDLVIRGFKASDTEWLIGGTVELSSDDLFSHARSIVTGRY